MLLYQLYRLQYLLLVKIDEVIPDFEFTVPDYHTKFINIIEGIGYFLPLRELGQLALLLIGYEVFRLSLAFVRLMRNH